MRHVIFLVALLAPEFRCHERVPLIRHIDETPTWWNWGQRLPTKASIVEAKNIPNKQISQRPFFPFSEVGASAGPLQRNDGTIKSRNPHDTLKPGYVTNGLEEGFTTLDVLQKETKRHQLFPLKIKGSLGGLDPKEVFYADDDLIIIKGGGYGKAVNEESHEETNSVDDFDLAKWSVKNLPHLDEEYNGNVATIVAPPNSSPYWRGSGPPPASTMHSPLSLFLPANALAAQESNHIFAQESNHIYRIAKPFNYPMASIIRPYFIQPHQPIALIYVPMSNSNYEYFGNFLPSQNEFLASYENTRKPAALQSQFKRPAALQSQFKRPAALQSQVKIPAALQNTYPSRNYSTKGKKPPTYFGDTNVNVLDPNLRINEDAEIISKPRPPK